MIFDEFSVNWALILIFASVFSIFLSSYSLYRKSVAGARELSFFLFATAMYGLGIAFEVTAHELNNVIEFIKFAFFWSSLTAPAFFLFALRYFCGKKLNKAVYAIFLAASAMLGILGITIESHNLVYTSYGMIDGPYFPVFHYESGPVNFLQLIYLIGTAFAGEVLLLIKALRSRGKFRIQSFFVFIGSTFPLINAILFPERTAAGIDTQPIFLMVAGIFIAISLFHFQMFDLVKIAREKAVDNIRDFLVVLDCNLTVCDINRPGKEALFLKDLTIGRPLSEKADFAGFLLQSIHSNVNESVYCFDNNFYLVKINRIEEGKKRHEIGFVIIIHDITESMNLMNELEQLATVDSLTGIYNRRQWMNLARRELEVSRRKAVSVCVIVLDIDCFKNVNDTYGHIFGDEVLKSVTDKIKRNLRSTEILGRYGGEEFSLICSNADETTGVAIAERIRRSIEDLSIAHEGESVSITASFGVYHSPASDSEDLESLIHFADTAMYSAKESGRNCSRCFRKQKVGS